MKEILPVCRPCGAIRSHLARTILFTAIVGLLIHQAPAQTLKWDSDPVTPGIQSGNGDWDSGNLWWNGTMNIPWPGGGGAIFSGQPVVDAGGISVDDITFNGSGSLGSSAGSLLLTGGDGVHEIAVSVSGHALISAPLAGTEGLTKTGRGILTLSGQNTYGGPTSIVSGGLHEGTLEVSGGAAIPDGSSVSIGYGTTLQLLSDETIGTLTSNSNGTVDKGTVDLNSHILGISGDAGTGAFVGQFIGTGGINLVSGGVLAVNYLEFSYALSAPISGQGTLIQRGGGQLKLTGANSFTGTLYLENGDVITANLGQAGVDNPLGQAAVKFGHGNLIYTGATAATSDRPLFLEGPGGIDVTNAGVVATFSGPISGNATSPIDGKPAVLTINSVNSFSGKGSVELTNPANSFAGDVALYSGTLSVSYIGDAGVNSPLGSGSNVFVDVNSTLRITGPGSYSSNRSFNISSGIMEVSADTSLTLTGIMKGDVIKKTGAGTLTLSGNNSFTSVLTVAGGKLAVSGGSAIPDGTNVSVFQSATFEVLTTETIGQFFGPGSISLASGAFLTLTKFSEVTGGISGAGGLVKSGNDILTLSGTNTFTGGVTVNGGTLRLTGNISSPVTASGGRFETTAASVIGDLTLAGGVVLPGLDGGVAALHTGNVDFSSGYFAVDLASASSYDSIDAIGGVTFDGDVQFGLKLGFDPVDFVDEFRLVVNDGADPTVFNGSGRFVNGGNVLEDGEQFLVINNGFSQFFEIQYGDAGGDNDVRLVAAPEPSSALLLLAAGALLYCRRRWHENSVYDPRKSV